MILATHQFKFYTKAYILRQLWLSIRLADLVSPILLIKLFLPLYFQFIAIGETTQAAMLKQSLVVTGTCDQPTPQSLVQTLNTSSTHSS